MVRPIIDTYTNWDSLTQGGTVKPFFEFDLLFGSGIEFLEVTLLFSTVFYSPSGRIIGITFPKDNILGEKQQFTITLNIQDPTLVLQLQNSRQDSGPSPYNLMVGVLSFWFLTSSDQVDSQSNYVLTYGMIDSCELTSTPDGTIAVLTFAASSDWQWDRPIEGRYTDVYQKNRRNTGNANEGAENPHLDKGFEFVEQLQDWQLFWAKGKTAGKKGKKTRIKKHRKKNR